MRKKYLKIYRECASKGKMPKDGLCGTLKTMKEFKGQYQPEVLDQFYFGAWFWAYDGHFYDFGKISNKQRHKIARDFTPLRQNILLLIAAQSND